MSDGPIVFDVPDVSCDHCKRAIEGAVAALQAGSPVRRPDLPDGLDVERLLTGRHVPPERLAASWTLLRSWLDAKAWWTRRVRCLFLPTCSSVSIRRRPYA